MKNSELVNKSYDELAVLVNNYKKELFNLRFQKSSGVLTNTSRFAVVRKTVARIKTLMNNPKVNGETNA